MKLSSIVAKDIPPIILFRVNSLANVVVLAGPNGVGKTRLTQQVLAHLRNARPQTNISVEIEATSGEERDAWGKDRLSTTVAEEAAHFKTTLQSNRRRKNWKSSIITFESDRSIQKVQPYAFTWDMEDPYEEKIGWDTTFKYMRDRFKDTLHSMFRLIEYQKRNIANRAIQLRKDGKSEMRLNFPDPMEPFKKVFTELLAPKVLIDPNPKNLQLEYELDGHIHEFDTLSSGEREVVNVAFDFLLRNPSDCIVFFDEPELHLHPELSYRLIRTLQGIGTSNQFIFCTHSPDVISSALEQSVVFLGPPIEGEPSGEPQNQAKVITEDDETNQALRLLGHSIGVISLGKKIVLIEGEQSSLDKQTYGSIIRNCYPQLVLVPCGGKDLIQSFQLVSEKVLDRTLWGVEFFMLCDGDSMPLRASVTAGDQAEEGKLRVLGRYHVENYFLDEHVWAKVFSHMETAGSWLRSADQIRAKMVELAYGLVSYSVALSITASVRMTAGNVSFMPRNCHDKSVAELKDLVSGCIEAESRRIETALNMETIKSQIEERFQRIQKSLADDSDEWKELLPGRALLGKFVGLANLGMSRARTMYIREALASSPSPFDEIENIFRKFAEF